MHIKYCWTFFNFIYYIYNFLYKNIYFFKKLGPLTINIRGTPRNSRTAFPPPQPALML